MKPSLMLVSSFRSSGEVARPDCLTTFAFDGAVSSVSTVHFGFPEPVCVPVQPSGVEPVRLLSKPIAWFDMSFISSSKNVAAIIAQRACSWRMSISFDVTVERQLTSAPSFKKPHRTLDCLPGKMSACHVSGIEAGVTQRRGRLTSDMKAIDAECDDRFGLRQGTDP